jgi:4-amino-4-deoxy-L-arabinose transferase-like glycosyltransferase
MAGNWAWADLDRLRDSVCSIVRCVAFMKRIFSHTVAALAAGLCLRLFFAFKFPFAPSDTALYEQLATNWLQHHVYAVTVDGALVPVDLRMPGYPAFLAGIYAITGHTGPDARFYVVVAQAAVDLCACLVTAGLAALLALLRPDPGSWRRVYIVTLWIAALCPFTANYAAVPMTEVFAIFFTAAALVPLIGLMWSECGGRTAFFMAQWAVRHGYSILALASGLLTGMGTLFRPETPLLLVMAWILFVFLWLRKRRFLFWAQLVALSAIGCALPLAPWAIRNVVTLHEVQFLTPKNLNMAGEFVPLGFMAWEKTWLFRMKDCFLVPWKLDGEVINLEDIPARAFDTPEEKERVAALLEQYNNDVTITPEEDAAFGELARERTARHPLRTYVWLPVARAFTIWFTPRIELLPFSGKAFPVTEAWREDPIDLSVTLGYFFLNVLYVAFAIWGGWRLWRENSALGLAVALLLGYVLLRTAFLTTLETPEPRYVLECFPAVLALAGQVFVRSVKPPDLVKRSSLPDYFSSTGSG